MEIYDSRKIAEQIIDKLLLNDSAMETLENYLPTLNWISTLSAATNLMPKTNENHVELADFEALVTEKLQHEKVVAISGISGVGKSDLAAVVGNSLRSQFDTVLWIKGEGINDVADIAAVPIERKAQRLNAQQLLKEGKCLIVLDNLTADLTVNQLKEACGPNSAVLVTRQRHYDGDLNMPFLNKEQARSILEKAMPTACPDAIFDKIWRIVGGHPLALRFLNATAILDNSWGHVPSLVGKFGDPLQDLT